MDFSLETFAIVLGACAVVAALTLRLRQSVIVGYLMAGVLIGPYGLGLVQGRERVEGLGDLGIVFLLFLLGNELSLDRIRGLARPAFVGGSLYVAFTILAILGITSLYGWNWYLGIYLGCVASISSTAILIKLMSASGEIRAPQGKFALGVSLFQDLMVVPMMVVLPVLAVPGKGLVVETLAAGGKAAAFLLLSYILGRWIIPPVLRRVTRSRSQELFTLTVLALALGMAVESNRFGLSLAMGAFIAGLALGQSPYSQKVLADVLPFRDAFLSLFFVSIGMLLDWRTALAQAPVLAATVVLILVVKTLVGAGVGRLLGLPLGMALQAGFALSPLSELSFLLARMGHGAGHIGDDLYQMMISSSVISMAAAPWLLKIGSRAVSFRERRPRAAAPSEGAAHGKAAPAGLRDHVVICGFGPVGRLVAEALEKVGEPFVVIELNPDTVERARREGVPVAYGDARSEVLLETAGIDRARAAVVAIPGGEIAEGVVRNVRLRCPRLPIFARAVFLPQARRLREAGATATVHDEREAGRAIVRALLPLGGLSPEGIEDLLEKVDGEG
jgi:monovalent cation:H+ antiporter-2, CPA2 family